MQHMALHECFCWLLGWLRDCVIQSDFEAQISSYEGIVLLSSISFFLNLMMLSPVFLQIVGTSLCHYVVLC